MDWPSRHSIFVKLIAACCLLGAYVSGELLSLHDGGWQAADGADAPLLISLCHQLSGSAGCDEISRNRWASFDVYLGGRRVLVPTAFLGLAWFVGLAAWMLSTNVGQEGGRQHWRMLIVACGISVLLSIGFAGLMVLGYAPVCLLCLVAHALNGCILGLMLLAGRAARRHAGSSGGELVVADSGDRGVARRPRRASSGGLAVVIAVAGLWLYYDATRTAKHYFKEAEAALAAIDSLQENEALMLALFDAQSIEPALAQAADTWRQTDASSRQMIRARDDRSPNQRPGPPRLVLFSDYHCPACACFEKIMRQQIAPHFGEALQVEYRHFWRGGDHLLTIDPTEFAPGVERPGATNRSEQSARAALAAYQLGGPSAFAAYRTSLYRHRHDEPAPNYAKLASDIGLDPADHAEAMKSDEVTAYLASSRRLADALQLTHTPAVFLGGREVPPICLRSKAFWRAIAQRYAGDPESAASTIIEDQTSDHGN